MPNKVIWLTGLPKSGKTTLGQKITEHLKKQGCKPVLLDGDVVRKSICSDLKYSEADRFENVRRIAGIAKVLHDQEFWPIITLVSPKRYMRAHARSLFKHGDFVEVFVSSSLKTCKSRDNAGIYQDSRFGSDNDHIDVTTHYEEPIDAEIVVDTEKDSACACVRTIMSAMK